MTSPAVLYGRHAAPRARKRPGVPRWLRRLARSARDWAAFTLPPLRARLKSVLDTVCQPVPEPERPIRRQEGIGPYDPFDQGLWLARTLPGGWEVTRWDIPAVNR